MAFFCINSYAFAQEAIRNQGGTSEGSVNNPNSIQIGCGFPNRLATYFSDYQTLSGGSVKSNLTYSVSYDRSITDNLSIGGYLAYGSATWTVHEYTFYYSSYMTTNTYTLSALALLFRATYYIPMNESFQWYAGVAVGKGALAEDLNGSAYDAASVIMYDVHAGGLYYFNEHVGMFGEIGFGLAYLNGGFSFKF